MKEIAQLEFTEKPMIARVEPATRIVVENLDTERSDLTAPITLTSP